MASGYDDFWGTTPTGADAFADPNWGPPSTVSGNFGSPGATSGGGGMNSAQIAELTRMVNEINQAANVTNRETNLPGVGAANALAMRNNTADLNYSNPARQNAVLNRMANWGVLTGNINAPSGGLGIALTEDAQKWADEAQARNNQLLAANPAAPLYDAGNQVTTAAQQLQAQLTREQMANAYRIAQLSARNSKGGGGGGTPSHPNIGTSAGNWQSVFGSGNSQGLDKFGRNMDAPGWSFPTGYWDIARPEGPPMGTENGTPFPWGTEGATGTTVDASTNFSSDMADFNDWFYRDGGGD